MEDSPAVFSSLFDALPAWLWPFKMLDYYTRQCKRCGQVQDCWEMVEDAPGFDYLTPGHWYNVGEPVNQSCRCQRHTGPIPESSIAS